MTLALFEIRVLTRSRWLIGGGAIYALLAAGVTALGLSTFRILGLGSASPAALALLDLGLLLPMAFALVTGSAAVATDREGGFLAMLRAAGRSGGEITRAKIASATVAAWLMLAAGYGASALVLAGNVPAAQLPVFGAIFGVTLAGALAAASVGVLVGAVTRTRQEALLASLAIWFAFAVGMELVVLALAPLIRAGAVGLLLLVLFDPLEAARTLGLIALGMEGELLGSLGALLTTTQGRFGAAVVLIAALGTWIGGAAATAAWLVGRRSS